jgi:hypothetical protein
MGTLVEEIAARKRKSEGYKNRNASVLRTDLTSTKPETGVAQAIAMHVKLDHRKSRPNENCP